MTALEIVNEVQRELRLPLSASITDPHAKLMLSFVNKVARSFMVESVVWDEIKVYGSLSTQAGTEVYTVTDPSGGELDVIRSLKIGTEPEIERLRDDDFRAYKRVNTAAGQPQKYRIYGKSNGSILIETCPAPDTVYQVDFEALKKPPKLVNATDVPLLDSDTIVLGAVMLARKEQGEDYSGDLAAFQAKLALQGDTQGESNWGDVEAV